MAIPVTGALIFALLCYLPSAPKQQALGPAGSGFGTQNQTDFFCQADGVDYLVGYTDIPAAVMAPLHQAHDTTPLLEAYKSLLLERSGSRLSSGYRHPTTGTYTIDIMGERSWLAHLQDGLQDRLPRWGRNGAKTPQHTHVMRVQLQLHGERLYMMHALQPDPSAYNQALVANRALRSFQVAKNK